MQLEIKVFLRYPPIKAAVAQYYAQASRLRDSVRGSMVRADIDPQVNTIDQSLDNVNLPNYLTFFSK